MIKSKDVPTLYVDVDDTLVMWGLNPDNAKSTPGTVAIETVWPDGRKETVHLMPNDAHIELLKEHKYRGHEVIIWSAGGAVWAEAVVKALKLEEFVDYVHNKPDWYIDDLKAGDFMPESIRIYKGKKRNIGYYTEDNKKND